MLFLAGTRVLNHKSIKQEILETLHDKLASMLERAHASVEKDKDAIIAHLSKFKKEVKEEMDKELKCV